MCARRLVALTLMALAIAAPAHSRDFIVQNVPEPPSADPVLDSGLWVHNAVRPSGEHTVAFARQVQEPEGTVWQVIVTEGSETEVASQIFRQVSFLNVGVVPTDVASIFYQDGLPASGYGISGQILRGASSYPWYEEEVVVDVGAYASTQYPASVSNLNNRRVAYFATSIYGEGSASLYHARPNMPAYETELIDSAVTALRDRGRVIAIDVDPSFDPGIAYVKGDDRLHYAEFDGTNWHREPIYDVVGQSVAHVDLDIDGAGIPHVSFYLMDTQDLMYATRGFDGTWTVETAAFNGSVGKWSSIAVDPAGVPHISCFRETDDVLLLVSPAPGDTWQAEVVDSGGRVGEYSSLSIDAYGGMHLAYYDATNGRAKRAWWIDVNVNGIHDATDIANGLLTDCDGNGIHDPTEILFGYAEDCDNNGVPDKCEQDCDGDGTLDACQIAANPLLDCDGSGSLDVCDIAAGARDCNGNGLIDGCELEALPFLDCDGNQVLDECDIAAGASDCDGDGIMDRCSYELGLELAGTGQWFEPNNRAGRLVAAGDFDADELGDVIVAQDGDTYLFRGASPMNDTIDQRIRNARALAAGDVDGDGNDDLAVATSSIISGERVFLFRGGDDPVLAEDLIITSPDSRREFGTSIALADLDGDGHDDLVVGAPGQFFDDTGAVYVYYSNPLDGTPDLVFDAAYPQDFGVCVANAGDLDGNGCEDVAIGIPTGLSLGGEVQIHFFQPDRTSLAGPVIPGDAAYQQAVFGEVLAGVGDLNGDGFDDLAIGVPEYSTATQLRGRVYIHFGATNMDAASDLIISGSAPLARLGASVAGGADLNGDGFDDLVIGAMGDYASSAWVQVHFGGPFLDDVPEAGWATDTGDYQLRVPVAIAPDVDGDGHPEVVYGAPGIAPHGLAYLRSVPVPDFADCDGNGILDFCDIAGGVADADLNGIPDPCETATSVEGPVLPSRARLVGAFPTPFNPRTTIVFDLARTGAVELTIYDAAGRRVDTLLTANLGAGRHEVVWNASPPGRPLASGVYFAILRGDGVLERCKMVLLK